MTRIVFLSTFLLILTTFHPAFAENIRTGSHLQSGTISSSGAIHLTDNHNQLTAHTVLIRLNNQVNGLLKIFHSKANNRDSIRGNFLITNSTNKKVLIKYRLVFKDKIGIVAQTTGELHLAPGKQSKKFGNIVLSQQDIKNIHLYHVKMEMIN